jgi:hypothetical protein
MSHYPSTADVDIDSGACWHVYASKWLILQNYRVLPESSVITPKGFDVSASRPLVFVGQSASTSCHNAFQAATWAELACRAGTNVTTGNGS